MERSGISIVKWRLRGVPNLFISRLDVITPQSSRLAPLQHRWQELLRGARLQWGRPFKVLRWGMALDLISRAKIPPPGFEPGSLG